MELGWCPGRVDLVAGCAVSRCADVVGTLASGIGAVVAARASGCTGKRAVVCFGPGPDRG